ncbi:hypothetical protein OROMI_004028 [Orobanche minor]
MEKLKCWAMKKSLESRLEAAEMRMLRWSCGRTLLDKIPNGVFRYALEVAPISAKARKGRLRWFGHVRRRQSSAPVRRVESLLVVGGRRRGRPRRTWEEQLKLDLKALNLSEAMTVDRCSWRRHIRVVDSFFGSGSVVESLRVGLSRGYARRVNYSTVRAEYIEFVVVKFSLGEGLHGNSLPTAIVGAWSAYILPSSDPALSGIYWVYRYTPFQIPPQQHDCC